MNDPSEFLTDTDQIRILVVDDEEVVRDSVARFLRKVGFQVLAVGGGAEALARLERDRFTVMILDVRMPDLDGIQVLNTALDRDPDLSVIMLTGMTDAATAAHCMQLGAVEYLTKPIEMNALKQAVDHAFRRRETLLQERGLSNWLREELEQRTLELDRERQILRRVSVATLEALINALEAKDPHIIGHSARVAALASTIANELDLSDDQVDSIRTAARLHDVGKIGIRESVLTKKAPLSVGEYEHAKQHVMIGFQILSPLEHLGPVAEYVKHHHEHWDGNGYPDGLSGEEIPIGSRIIAAAEIFDTLTNKRPYHSGLSTEDALERLRRLGGNVLDPSVVQALDQAVTTRQTLTFLTE